MFPRVPIIRNERASIVSMRPGGPAHRGNLGAIFENYRVISHTMELSAIFLKLETDYSAGSSGSFTSVQRQRATLHKPLRPICSRFGVQVSSLFSLLPSEMTLYSAIIDVLHGTWNGTLSMEHLDLLDNSQLFPVE